MGALHNLPRNESLVGSNDHHLKKGKVSLVFTMNEKLVKMLFVFTKKVYRSISKISAVQT